MKLKHIELAGFKSFVDPTKIDLGDGITSIVGPNGCGKSNIVDAIRWVLGEHSAKHLRGGVMDDLIFQGSDSRPPVALCDVELTFAVERGALPSPYHEMDEIRIRRRLTRDGGSDGFINGKMVRIKDIIDIFLDTGISTRAYAIVEQGSISRMITAKPEERRSLFEEAAGVMKYRSRRRESELKMNSTRQNLERVTDLLEEVRTQCRSLKQQSSRAERFKQLQDEHEQLQAQSFAIRYRRMQQQLDAVKLQLAEAKKGEAEKSGRHAEAEKELARAREALIAHETEAQIRQDELRGAEQQRADLQQQAERMAGERKLLTERKGGLEQRISEATQRSQQLTGELTQLEAQIAGNDDSRLQQAREAAAAKVAEAEKLFGEAREARDARLADYERLRSAFENQEKRRSEASSALERLQSRRGSIAGQIEETATRLQEGEAAVKHAADVAAAATKRAAETVKALDEAQRALDRRRSEREAAIKVRGECEAEVRALRGQARELEAQLAHQELPEALREKMREKGGVWIDEALQVPKGLEQAVAAALRGRAADVALPANPGLATLKEICNEAGAAPIAMFASGLKGSSTATSASLAEAIGLAGGHDLYPLFAGTRLCDDIFAAGASEFTQVSRDGWRLEADGWLIPPAQSHTARRLTLQNEQRECESALAIAEKALEKLEQSVAATEEALAGQQQSWQKLHLETTEAESARKSAQAEGIRHEESLNAIRSRHAHLNEELAETGKNITHWQEQQQGLSQMDNRQLLDAKAVLDAQVERQQKCEEQLHHARGELAASEQTLALHRQALENLQRDKQRIEQERANLTGRVEHDRQQLQKTVAEIEAAAQHKGLDRELAEAAAAVEKAHQTLNTIRQKGHELQQNAHKFERAEREARSVSQHAGDVRQKIDIQIASEETRMQDLAEEIGYKFRVSPGELLKKVGDSADEDADAIVQKARELEERLSRFGPVNLLAIEEFKQASEREEFLATQAGDLESSLKTLEETISRIDKTMRQRFVEVFNETNRIFKEMFPRLFGGGRAELVLDSEDVLTAGVNVVAQPPGKRLSDIGLLSGGEKALTAVALVFSIFKIKPAPFCILDEVDAPLDDANVGRYNDMIKELSDRVQFLAISHNKLTMQSADRLVGVSMPEAGVSKIVAVDMSTIH